MKFELNFHEVKCLKAKDKNEQYSVNLVERGLPFQGLN